MFELAAIDTAIHALTMNPPAIIRPVMEDGESIKAFEKRMNARLDEAERATQKWVSDGVLASQNMADVIQEARSHTDPVYLTSVLDRYIDAVERVLSLHAKELEALEAGFKRSIKRAKSMNPQYAVVVEGVADRTLAIGEIESEGRSQFALLLRALKAGLQPDAGRVVTFSDPKDLDAFLRNAIAS